MFGRTKVKEHIRDGKIIKCHKRRKKGRIYGDPVVEFDI